MAIADIICGDVNPSGKLADTIPDSYDSYQNAQEFLTGFEHLDYFDDIYVYYLNYNFIKFIKFDYWYKISWSRGEEPYSKIILIKKKIGSKIFCAIL